MVDKKNSKQHSEQKKFPKRLRFSHVKPKLASKKKAVVEPEAVPHKKVKLTEEQKKARRLLMVVIAISSVIVLVVAGVVLALARIGYFSTATVYIKGNMLWWDYSYRYTPRTVSLYVDDEFKTSTELYSYEFSFTIKVEADREHKFQAKSSDGLESDLVTQYIYRGRMNSVTLDIPGSSSNYGFLYISGYNYGVAQTLYLYIDSEYVASEYATYTFSFGYRKVTGNTHHEVVVKNSDDFVLYSETFYVGRGDTVRVNVIIRETTLYVSGKNYGAAKYIYLYIDAIQSDTIYVDSGSDFSFAEKKVVPGSHTVQIKDRSGNILNSTVIQITAGMARYVVLNLPGACIYVHGTNHGWAKSIYLYIDTIWAGSTYVGSGSGFSFEKYVDPGTHSIQIKNSSGNVLNSTVVFVAVWETKYVQLDLPAEAVVLFKDSDMLKIHRTLFAKPFFLLSEIGEQAVAFTASFPFVCEFQPAVTAEIFFRNPTAIFAFQCSGRTPRFCD